MTTLIGIIIYLLFGLTLYFIRPSSKIHKTYFDFSNIKHKMIWILSCVITILICTIPMKYNPLWNGDIPEHRNQYELISDQLIKGEISFDYKVDEKLIEMDNPYDYQAREDKKIDYYWDHAFYNNKYYMYFGIVPAIILFVPFKLITGKTLITYQATQIFTLFFIIGIYALFSLLMKKIEKKFSIFVVIFTSMSISIMSIWYIAAAPALYCTAIVSGMCMMIWSFYFFFKAAYICNKENLCLVFATIGSLFGALAFGCRPPIALANIIAIPMYIDFLKEKKKTTKFILKNILIFIPYIIIGLLLMYYNYIRFDNIFEFGQSYQLTVTDQSNYGNLLANFNLLDYLYALYYNFLNVSLTFELPHIGCLFTYPIIICAGILAMIKYNKHKQPLFLSKVILTSIISILLIICIDTLSAPQPSPRYRLDFIWIISIIVMILVINFVDILNNNSAYIYTLSCFATICISVLLFISPHNSNLTAYFWPESKQLILKIFSLGLYK